MAQKILSAVLSIRVIRALRKSGSGTFMAPAVLMVGALVKLAVELNAIVIPTKFPVNCLDTAMRYPPTSSNWLLWKLAVMRYSAKGAAVPDGVVSKSEATL